MRCLLGLTRILALLVSQAGKAETDLDGLSLDSYKVLLGWVVISVLGGIINIGGLEGVKQNTDPWLPVSGEEYMEESKDHHYANYQK